ncbi:nicotinate-nucleotide diphosphorylase (carboxylating) [Saccharospirillum sp. MSK14-1]|uniref:carboxylating nicotinate-nucleotide diphosphorylase n=1 Tax=Saccharospirillum sp. MSK14-1 TaxID=1897632 RepID=UPI000D33298E|nr:carboxylating nicotinate-nucleotide diphosphorylase [Saccharospirillum sp. MSK14-1]PTY38961.1 nicotinate-nucleotide diphosphorylase (carboxylating) [Saccharospirillum sp. MSK14-1]
MFIADTSYAATLQDHLNRTVRFALEEDLGNGDITAQLIPLETAAKASVITREAGVLCGREWFTETFRQIDDQIQLSWYVEDGNHVQPNDTLVDISGSARSILTAERCALNFLQTLSGTATAAHHYASRVAETPVTILDTRKTLPGLRLAQKYAALVGGCENHRLGLYDRFLIKENHIMACGGIRPAIEYAKALHAEVAVEVEVETMTQLDEAIDAGADIVMLDNFDTDATRRAVERAAGRVKLESSGNFDLDRLNADLAAGAQVDFISVGAITKHVQALDLSLRLIMQPADK